jgi:predicted nucleotidyltransferase
MTNKIYTIEEIKDIVKDVLLNYDVSRVYLFGSYSRNEADSNSDIDFYIENYKYKRFYHLGTLFTDLEERFGKKIDIVTDSGISDNYNSHEMPLLLKNIKREGVLVY